MDKTKPVYLTPQGKIKLEQELSELESKRPIVVDEVQKARAMGDLRENNAYHANRERLKNIDHRLTELKLILRQAEVVEKTKTDEIQIGSRIKVQFNGETQEFELVGQSEADPTKKKISLESPLGKILIGKKPGDKVKYMSPMGEREYKILAIS